MERGIYLWARTTIRYWPALVVSAEEASMKPLAEGFIYVYWFGDNRISMVSLKNCVPFAAKFVEMYSIQNSNMGQKWKAGVLEAIQAYSELENDISMDDALKIAYETYSLPTHVAKKEVPHKVSVELSKRMMCQWKPFNTTKHIENLKDVFKGILNVERICLACYCREPHVDHPIFHGKLCQECENKLYHTIFATSCNKYCSCTICGNNINMLRCFNKNCKRLFCGQCIKNLQMRKCNNWLCPICSRGQSVVTYVRPDYNLKILNFLAPGCEIKTFPPLEACNMNMLILFHGKSKALELLFPRYEEVNVMEHKNLIGFSSLKAINFAYLKAHFVDLIKGKERFVKRFYQRELDLKRILDLGNIGILLGGTAYPAVGETTHDNDFQAKLFWEFNRVHNIMKTYSLDEKSDFKFVFELNATISKLFVDIISRYLETTPFLLRASPGKEFRLVWTNLPNQ